jgi:hypothetical protein
MLMTASEAARDRDEKETNLKPKTLEISYKQVLLCHKVTIRNAVILSLWLLGEGSGRITI